MTKGGRTMRARLIALNGKQAGRESPLPAGRLLVGRGRDCQIRPASERVSRHHCVLTITPAAVRQN